MMPDEYYARRAAQELRRTRQGSGLSLREVARIAGTSHATLLAYETGKKIPSVATYLRLLEACGVAADIVVLPRIRRSGGMERGEELAQVLRLAEQFPASVTRHVTYPKLKLRG